MIVGNLALQASQQESNSAETVEIIDVDSGPGDRAAAKVAEDYQTQPEQSGSALWDDWFQLLLDYKNKFGHTSTFYRRQIGCCSQNADFYCMSSL